MKFEQEELKTPELGGFIESAERREAVMEKAREGRIHLLGDISRSRIKEMLTSKKADMTGDMVPVIDGFKMAIEAGVGKTSSGESLTGRRRVNHAIIAAGVTLAYALPLAGLYTEAASVRAAVWAVAGTEYGPEGLRAAAEKAREKFPKISHMMERTADFAEKKRDDAIEVIKRAREGLSE